MKNTFTFPHDYGARNDPELQRLLFEYGPEAGWSYWVLIEMLYEQGGKMPKASYPQVAYAAHVGSDLVKNIVEGSTLFESDKKYFWSRRVDFTLETKEEKSSKGRTAAQAKWAKWKKERESSQNSDAELMQTHSECTADAMPNNNNNNSNSNSNNINIGSSLHSEPCPTDEQSDAGKPPIFPETQVPVETKTDVLSNKHCQQVVDFWNRKVKETGAQFPQVKSLSDDRKKKIRIRWEEFKQIGNPVDVCRSLFEKATASKFLQGDNPKGWAATFDWIFTNGKNWLKIYEGNYDEHPVGGSSTKSRINSLKDEFNKIDEIFGGHPNGTEQSDFGIDEQ